jgi:hypothetical protein
LNGFISESSGTRIKAAIESFRLLSHANIIAKFVADIATAPEATCYCIKNNEDIVGGRCLFEKIDDYTGQCDTANI